jgi:hypothetical protein
MRWLEPVALQNHLKAFDQTDLGAAIATAIGSGCRRASCWHYAGVTLLDKGTLRIARSLERVTIGTPRRTRYELRFKEPETKRSRGMIAFRPLRLHACAVIAWSKRSVSSLSGCAR